MDTKNKAITIGEDLPLTEWKIVEYRGICRKCGFITKFRQLEFHPTRTPDKCYKCGSDNIKPIKF